MAVAIRFALPGAGTAAKCLHAWPSPSLAAVALAARLPEVGVALAGRSFIPTPT